MSVIAVVAKQCLPGRVKTRLSPALSPAHAAAVAQASLDMTLDAVRRTAARRRVLLFDGRPPAGTHDFEVVPQAAGGLDERLAALFAAIDEPLLLIGMDTPQVDPAVLDAALDDRDADAWFGPAADGGFWLLGMSRPRPDLIRGVPMSQPETGAAQLARLHAAGLRVRVLPSLRDVDTVDDAAAVAALLPGSPFADALALRAAA